MNNFKCTQLPLLPSTTGYFTEKNPLADLLNCPCIGINNGKIFFVDFLHIL